MTIAKYFERFQYFKFEKHFLKNDNLVPSSIFCLLLSAKRWAEEEVGNTNTFFKKLEYCVLVDINKIENTKFLYKTA